jgi:hypothetical protein
MTAVRTLDRGTGRPGVERRVTLRPFEAAFVLQLPERDMTALVRRGALANVSRDAWVRLDPAEVLEVARECVARGELSPLALWALPDVVAGARRVDRRRSRAAKPETLTQFLANGHARSRR